MIDTSIHRSEQRESRGDQVIALIGRSLLLLCMVLGLTGISGCASPETIDMGSFDPAHDQKAIARYYWNQAMAMREKAKAQATAVARYEALFGPEADLVSGARLLTHYYEQTAQELERRAEAHAAVGHNRQRPQADR